MLAEETPALFRAFDLLAIGDEARSRAVHRAPAGRARAAASTGFESTRVGRADAARRRLRRRRALAGRRRGRDRQAARLALPARRAQGDGEGQAPAHDRRRGRGLAPGQGGGHGRLADPRPLRRRGELRVVGHTSGSRRRRSASWSTTLAPYETGERGSADPSRWSADRDLEWVAPAARARDRGHLRPRLRRPHPPRLEDPPLARRQGADRVPARAARLPDRRYRWPGGAARALQLRPDRGRRRGAHPRRDRAPRPRRRRLVAARRALARARGPRRGRGGAARSADPRLRRARPPAPRSGR